MNAVRQENFDEEMKLAQRYQDFFANKRNCEFVLYNHFPSMASLRAYLNKLSVYHPLYPYSVLNVKELAEIIKYVYQFQTGQKFHILTTGALNKTDTEKYLPSIPQVFLLVGNYQTMSDDLISYHGNFYNSFDQYLKLAEYTELPRTNFVKITLDNGTFEENGWLECFTEDLFNRRNRLNYYTNTSWGYADAAIKETKHILAQDIMSNIRSCKKLGIRNILSFNIHQNDSYLANILISIIIYKRNNGLKELSEEDYNHIFNILFQENAPIKEDSQKDFPRRLIYVPNPKTGK